MPYYPARVVSKCLLLLLVFSGVLAREGHLCSPAILGALEWLDGLSVGC